MTVETLFLIAFILLIAEAFIPSLGLLGFGGFIAFVVGVVTMISADMTHFLGLSLQSIIALGTLIFSSAAVFGFFLFKSFRKRISTGIEYMRGENAEVVSWKNDKGNIIFEGENWRAISDDTLKSGDTITITGYNKMTLTVVLNHEDTKARR